MAHRHQARRTEIRGFRGQARGAARENRTAHGGILEVAVCSCGRTRETNSNGRATERGTWLDAAPWHLDLFGLRTL